MTVAPADPTVWVGTPSVYPTLSLNQDRDAPRQSLPHRMIRHLGQGEASVYATVAWKLTEVTWMRSLQHRRCIASEQLCQKTSTAKWRGRGTGLTDTLKKLSIGSSNATFFSSFYPTASLMPWAIYTPSTHPFEVPGLCGSAEEFKTH
jgi:hypothetical protein